MKQREFVKATGATPRQLNYWRLSGIAFCDPQPFPGQGHYRFYRPECINRVKLLVWISNSFGTHFPVDLLKMVFDNYHREYIQVGLIWIEWRVDHVSTAYVSPRGRPPISR